MQQSGDVVEFKRRTAEDSNIASLNSIDKLYDYIRMLDAPGYPHAFLEQNKIKFSFYDAELIDGKISAKVEIEEI
jgi:methionyl-tRNA formyltransferase